MGRSMPLAEYRDVVDRVRDAIRLHVPPRSVVLIASKGDEELVDLDGYRGWHFPQDETGVYAGHHPADSEEAIAQLHRLQARGATHLVIPSTAAWWLDHYAEFAAHLKGRHTRTFSAPGSCVIYELDASVLTDSDDDGRESSGRAIAGSMEPTPRLRPVAPRARAVPRVLSILARYGTDDYPDADRNVADMFRRQMPLVDRTAIIVDNALPREHVERRADGVVIGGDNSAREFSAFDRALDFVGAKVWSFDLVHFATSAFKTLYTDYLDRFDLALIGAVAGRPACVGHIDCYNDPIEILSFHSQHWIRSCFFMLPPTEVKALGSLVTIRDGARFFSGDPAAPFRPDAPIGRTFREYITTWLTGGDIGQGVAWHSSFAITPETLGAFEQKAISILNEHLLSVRLRALGCHLADVSWLSTLLSVRRAADIEWGTGWREQLARRRVRATADQDARRVAVAGAI